MNKFIIYYSLIINSVLLLNCQNSNSSTDLLNEDKLEDSLARSGSTALAIISPDTLDNENNMQTSNAVELVPKYSGFDLFKLAFGNEVPMDSLTYTTGLVSDTSIFVEWYVNGEVASNLSLNKSGDLFYVMEELQSSFYIEEFDVTYYCEFGIISCGYVFYPKEESEPHLNHLAIVSKSGYEEHINLYGDDQVDFKIYNNSVEFEKLVSTSFGLTGQHMYESTLDIQHGIHKEIRTIRDDRDIDCFDLKGLSFDWYYMCRHRFSIHC